MNAFNRLNLDIERLDEIRLPESTEEINASFSSLNANEFYYNGSYNGSFSWGTNCSKVFLNKDSDTAKEASAKGCLVFDLKTGEALLPDCSNAESSMIIERMTKSAYNEMGENVYLVLKNGTDESKARYGDENIVVYNGKRATASLSRVPFCRIYRRE